MMLFSNTYASKKLELNEKEIVAYNTLAVGIYLYENFLENFNLFIISTLNYLSL
jgi:hypothetical protein